MVTDWVLVRRLGYELEQRLGGARVSEVGLLADGRAALALRRRGSAELLAVDPFSSPPLVTVESQGAALAAHPGFIRAAGALRGMTLTGVRARLGDRLLRLTFASRSRFGVGDELELYLELVPRFGNLVLVKRDRVVAAAKEFSLAENVRRAVAAGLPYALPPLPADAPSLPRVIAQSGLGRDAFISYAQSDEVVRDPLYVYRRGGLVEQAHVVPLAGFDDASCTREPSLLAVFAELRAQDERRGERERAARRRRAVVKRLVERDRKLRAELGALEAKRHRAGERDALRTEGTATFATLHELPEGERDAAKERATKLFAQYKKLQAALPHLDRREREVRASLAAVDALQWEAERVDAEEMDDLETAVALLDAHQNSPARSSPARKRKRAPLEFRTPDGSRVLVGRSPVENADLTFKVARPHDLWFHARGIPGAHVILARDDRTQPSNGDVETAAALAAYYSKAKSSLKVPVDYTLRKHVRKQRNAAPGLVWYTDAGTVTVAPCAGVTAEATEVSPAEAVKG